MNKENAWLKYDEDGKQKIFDFCEGYKEFISKCKTERECVDEVVRQAKELGYTDINDYIEQNKELRAGDKVYATNMNKAVVLFVIGEESLEKGMRILGAHVDSPRLDLKQNPLYEDTEMALLDTHYYGGIKKYQWVAIPLALHGVVVKKDGTVIKISVGEDDNDPVFGVSDLLIHLSADQMQKKASQVVHGEALDILVGSMPLKGEEKDSVKSNILNIIKEKYDFEEEDFISAEIEVVPAGKARDYGLDRSMVMGYGQDDRVCAYTSMKALFDVDKTDKTVCCILVDKEEIGSAGASGMHSMFFENTVAEIIALQGNYSDLTLRRALQNSFMLSSDVNAAFDPNYPEVMEKRNSAYFGKGMVFSKYTGSRGKSNSNDANAEYLAKLRKILDDNNVAYQTAELGKVDQGGGGTIAYIMANYNMEVIDSGVAVLNMHAPWEITSKVDIYETTQGYKVFLENIN